MSSPPASRTTARSEDAPRGDDPQLSSNDVKDLIAGREEALVLGALHRTQQVRPDGVLAFFKGCLKKKVARDVVPAGGVGGELRGGVELPPGGIELPEDPYG